MILERISSSTWEGALKQTEFENRDGRWDDMDPVLYVEKNYREILPPDLEILQKHIAFYRENPPEGKMLEVGCGPNLYPVLAALPYVEAIDIIEYGNENIEYLRGQLDELAPYWKKWIEVLEALDPERYANVDFQRMLSDKVTIHQGSIFELPEGEYDAGSMHFVSESITNKIAEFNNANERFLKAIKPGGTVVAAFMQGSTGWDTAGVKLPAVPIFPRDVKESVERLMGDANVRVVENAVPVRKGDHGMITLHGHRC